MQRMHCAGDYVGCYVCTYIHTDIHTYNLPNVELQSRRNRPGTVGSNPAHVTWLLPITYA
jgi:hypothetical protein